MSNSTDLQSYSSDLPEHPEAYSASMGAWQQQPSSLPKQSMVRRYLAAALRYKWLVIAGIVLGAAGGLIAWRMIRPDYRAQGSLWISQEGRGIAGPIAEAGLLQRLAWIELLRSFSVLDPVVVEQRLYLIHDPVTDALFETFRLEEGAPFRGGGYQLTTSADGQTWTLSTSEGLTVETGTAGAPIGSKVGFSWRPPANELWPEMAVDFTVLSPRDAAVRLREGLDVSMDQLGNFMQVSLRDADPERAAGVLESVMQHMVDLARDLKSGRLDEENKILAEQLRVVEDDLRQAESDLESFRVQTITLPTEDGPAIAPGLVQTQGPVLSQFFQLRMQLDALRQDRERLENVLAVRDGNELRIPALELIPAVRESSQLVRYLNELTEARSSLGSLRERYTDEHVAVREARSRVETLAQVAIPQAAEAVLAELKMREAKLDSVIATRSTELEQIPPRAIEEARLNRRVQIATSLYTDLRQRYETSSLASRSSAPDLQILDRPVVPTVPMGDERMRWAGMTFAGILGVTLGLVLLLDRMDPRLRDPYDVTGEIGLPILGAVPHLKSRTPSSEIQVREAFRELRVNAEYAYGTARPLVLCVTSPAEQEGKSFVCANLAIAFAGLGRRTLLIDGDTRRGNTHELMRLPRKPGLTDYLADGGNGNGPVQLQPTEHANLWVLTCGSRRSGSPELLNSSAMQELLANARKRFDVIILDSPPLSAGADAFVLAAHAGSLAVVLRSGSTNKALTMVKLEPLLRLPVRILGAVLNDFVPSALYGNYRYYGDYLAGYHAHDEAPDQVGAADAGGTRALGSS